MILFPAVFVKKRSKHKLEELLQAERGVIEAHKAAVTQNNSMIEQAASDAKDIATAVVDQLTQVHSEGVLFVNYRGIILHANKEAYSILGRNGKRLIGRSIELVFSSKLKTVLGCSAGLFTGEHPCFIMPNEQEVRINEVSCLQYGEKLLNLKVSLFEQRPERVEDVTYLCKLSLR